MIHTYWVLDENGRSLKIVGQRGTVPHDPSDEAKFIAETVEAASAP